MRISPTGSTLEGHIPGRLLAVVSAGSQVCLTLGSVASLLLSLTICLSRFTNPDCLVLSGPGFWLV